MPFIAFDALGTLLSFQKPMEVFEQTFGLDQTAFKLWFAHSIRDYFACSHNEHYKPLSELMPHTLRRIVAMKKGEPPSDQDVSTVIKAFQSQLEPYKGYKEALERLCRAGYVPFIVTNSSFEGARKSLENGGCLPLFQDTDTGTIRIIACDHVGHSK
jgi:FMN phosphatase YigB (HAD superfamily)